MSVEKAQGEAACQVGAGRSPVSRRSSLTTGQDAPRVRGRDAPATPTSIQLTLLSMASDRGNLLATRHRGCTVSLAHERPPLATCPATAHVGRSHGAASIYVHRLGGCRGAEPDRHCASGERGHGGDARTASAGADESRPPARPHGDDAAGARGVWRDAYLQRKPRARR